MSYSNFPAGTVLPFAGSTAPGSWVLCYGQAISRTTYAHLFAVLGTTYGVGDGSTTFNLPDLRGRAPFGKDNMGGSTASRITAGGSGITGTTLGATGGTETHTLTTAQLASHAHNIYRGSGGNGVYIYATTQDGLGENTQVSSVAAGSGNAHQNTPPAIILNYIMKT